MIDLAHWCRRSRRAPSSQVDNPELCFLCVLLVDDVHFESIMTTVDPDTCERDQTGEPLKSLKKWRQASGRDRNYLDLYRTMPMVGMNTVLIKRGEVAVGDKIVLYPY